MELAVNMFTGGMVLDSHPLVQSSDTLSDALNATYITMNGNEVVLLNDMGNRRVDNAYLPAGYEPVGIKEHGGIIYVAAYNPITHRSQIGSFPSPERNMGVEYEDNGTEFTFESFLNESNYITPYGDDIRFIKNDIMLLPLTKDTSLHAGDKFTVYSDYIWANYNLITNFGNSERYHVEEKEPFNKEFTLSLGILNSLNEFNDITSTLQRFDGLGKIIKGLNSDYDKFNTGYFIAPEIWYSNLTHLDNEILNERNKIGANTYAYKLTGPLFLKVELNHIQLFSYNIETSISEANVLGLYTITLFVTGTATYNCPFPEEYNDCFDLYIKNGENNPYIIPLGWQFLEDSKSTVYDSTNDNYISSITKIYRYNVSSVLGTLDYIIAVKNSYNNDKQYYLSNLSEHSTIDISKIGTNSCELSVWKYKNSISNGEILSTLLDFKFDCYNDRETSFEDLLLSLVDLIDTLALEIDLSEIVEYNKEIGNGRQQLYIEWNKLENENLKIKPQHLYLVKIEYNKKSLITSHFKTCRFLLATSLFNSCYDEVNEDYVSDYGIFMGSEDNGTCTYSYQGYNANILLDSNLLEIRNKYLDISNNIDILDPIMLSLDKGFNLLNPLTIIVEDNLDLSFEFSEKLFKYGITIKCNKDWKINNLELYPLGITIVDGNTTINTSSSDIEFQTTTNKRYDSTTEEFNQKLENFDNNIVKIKENRIDQNSSNNSNDDIITFDIQIGDRIYFNFELDTKQIGNAYVDIKSTSKFFSFIEESMSENLRFNGITFWEHNTDWKWMFLCPYLNRNVLTQTEIPLDKKGDTYPAEGESLENSVYSGLDWDQTQRRELFVRPTNEWKLNELYSERFLPALLDMSCPFTFILFDREVFVSPAFTCASNVEKRPLDQDNGRFGGISLWRWYRYNSGYRDLSKVYYANRYCRVWWVNEDNLPIILNNSPSSGIFDSGNTTSDREKLTNIYKGIADFIGKVRVLNSNIPWNPWNFEMYYRTIYNNKTNLSITINDYSIPGNEEQIDDILLPKHESQLTYENSTMTGFDINLSDYDQYLETNQKNSLKYTYLVMPIKNKYINAWYPSPSNYLYSDDTLTNLKYTVHYSLEKLENTKVDFTNNNSQNITNLLKFKVEKNNIEKTKELNKNFKIDTSFSEQIFNISQQLDLTNYSIDLEESIVLSNKDPLSHLYIRSPYDSTKLVEVPENYPIQLNSGNKYNFPLTCTKEYIELNNHITNEFQISECRNLDVPRKQIRGEMIIWPSSKRIPVLRDTDLVVNKRIFN